MFENYETRFEIRFERFENLVNHYLLSPLDCLFSY